MLEERLEPIEGPRDSRAKPRKRHANERFGRLTLLEPVYRNGLVHHWLCRCDCGTEKVVAAGGLVSGTTKSCGCIRREVIYRQHEITRKHPTHPRVLSYYKRNAKARDLEWALDTEAFTTLISGSCFYCGAVPALTFRGHQSAYNGIDRVDNAIGYVVSNCVSCCSRCNRAKGGMSLADFLDWALRIAAHQAKGVVPNV